MSLDFFYASICHMTYNLHLGTEIGRLQERRGGTEGRALFASETQTPGARRAVEFKGPGMGGGSLPLLMQTDTCPTSYLGPHSLPDGLLRCITLRQCLLLSIQIPPADI